MSCDQSYPFPQVFLVDGNGSQQHSVQQSSLTPCWSFAPAQQGVRGHGKRGGFMGVSPSLALVMLMLFLLVFAALGFEAYQIHNLQTELRDIRPTAEPMTEFNMPQQMIGLPQVSSESPGEDNRPAAHVIGRIETREFHETLRWEPRTGQAFMSGGVAYRVEDGGLQVNKSGIYHVYSRVELIFKKCDTTSSFVHSVFVRRKGHSSPLILTEANRAGFCSQRLQHPWTTESYLGSAVKLQKLDRVFVNVSQPKILSHAHYANFFGLYEV